MENISEQLKALAHPIRLNIATILAKKGEDMYLNQIANNLGINRALAKIHLKRLERGGIVKSRVVLVENEAKALRYYTLRDFDIQISPKTLREGGGDNKR